MADDRPDRPVPGDGPRLTDDGRHVVVGGRRWRASDPEIPSTLRQELVDELMSARRAVGAGDESARSRVQHAKVALGERGRPWWEPDRLEHSDPRIRATILALLIRRNGSTICPSDVARVVGGAGWRRFLERVRQVASELQAEGVIDVVQRGRVVDAETATGPIRYRLTAGPS